MMKNRALDRGSAALGLYSGPEGVALSHISGCCKRGFRLHGLARLHGSRREIAHHVGTVLSGSASGTRLMLGCRSLADPINRRMRLPLTTTILVVEEGGHAYRAADGVWTVPEVALKVAISAARASDKLRLLRCEETEAFVIAASLIGQPGLGWAEMAWGADLLFSVACAMWNAVEELAASHGDAATPSVARHQF
jgi:hypothetical protein